MTSAPTSTSSQLVWVMGSYASCVHSTGRICAIGNICWMLDWLRVLRRRAVRAARGVRSPKFLDRGIMFHFNYLGCAHSSPHSRRGRQHPAPPVRCLWCWSGCSSGRSWWGGTATWRRSCRSGTGRRCLGRTPCSRTICSSTSSTTTTRGQRCPPGRRRGCRPRRTRGRWRGGTRTAQNAATSSRSGRTTAPSLPSACCGWTTTAHG